MTGLYDQYKRAKVETASPGQLILLGYENIERAIKNAINSCKEGDYVSMNNELVRAQKIINEFIIALDMSAGEIAQNLFKIYTMWISNLVKANIEKDIALMETVYDMVESMHNAWKEAVKQVDTSYHDNQRGGINLVG